MITMRYGYLLLAAVATLVPQRLEAVDLAAKPQAANELTVRPEFRAERLLTVPRKYASWINMTFDPQGRIIVSDQGNRMHRITPARLGQANSQTTVEPLKLGVGGAHGLVYFQQSLFVVTGGRFPESGVFRLRDTDGRGRYGAPERLLKIAGHGEHGPHAIVPGPQGDWLYVIAGNGSRLPSGITRDHVAHIRGTDRAAVPQPQGWVIRISADGKQRELFCQGLRNAYDLAFDPQGELFTFDSDNEGFYGMPWYRPTNIYHLVSGADYGWRQSRTNLRSAYPDNLPPVTEIGPGSPTGVVFGTRTTFPEKYRNALFACDWSYGRILAVSLQPAGASWSAGWELFASGRPLAVTDIGVGPDGALYFVTGGRSTQSHLYRISWNGKPPTTAKRSPTVRRPSINSAAMHTRRSMERFNGRVDSDAVGAAWPVLRSPDRGLRYAARTAIEHQPVDAWRDRVFAESDAQSAIEALVAIARQGDVQLRPRILSALAALDWNQLSLSQQLGLLRVYSIVFQRMGMPPARITGDVIRRLEPHYPAVHADLNRDLASLLYQLHGDTADGDTPGIADLTDRTLGVLEGSPTLMQQIHYVLLLAQRGISQFSVAQKRRLRNALDAGELRAISQRPYADQRKLFGQLMTELGISHKPPSDKPARPVVQKWTLEQLLPLLDDTSLKSADVRRGRAVYRSVRCANCHRLEHTGGVLGPALDGLTGRYSKRVILESLVLPSRVISDQYRSTTFVMKDGQVITGRIVNLGKGGYKVQSDPFRAFDRRDLPADDIEHIVPSQVSLMPAGLLDSLTADEIRDLLGYLLSAAAPPDPSKTKRLPLSRE